MDENAQSQKNRVAALSVISNSILVVFKLVVGVIIGSVSVISEAIHSGMDLVAAVIALVAVRISGRSPDEDHAFGHGKVEDIAAAVEALLIFAAAIWIIYEAVNKLVSPHAIERVGWGVLVMLISAIANLVVSHLLFKIGRKTESAALIADGWHLRTDVYTSVGVMAGLGIILIGGRLLPGVNLYWIDPVAAILVALLILRAALRLTIHAIRDLIDTSTSPAEKAWIHAYLRRLYPTVLSFHRLRTRKAGPERFIDFHMVVHSDMTVSESHKIADKILEDFKAQFPNADVILHIEPCDGKCSQACVSGCQLSDEQRAAIHLSRSHLS
ncbi:MAG: cation transporter [Chloroflexi bacterium]|nr:cation transporter [Chloroflexota bacterium]